MTRRTMLAVTVAAALAASLALTGAASSSATTATATAPGVQAGPTSVAPSAPAAPGRRYVALGDSYTSSPFTGPPAGDPAGCLRSSNDYPHLVAAQTGAELTDVSCSGAQSRDFAAPQPVRGGANPPQYDALRRDTQLASVGIGGNDIGFGEIVRTCISTSAFGTPCRDRYQGTLEPRIDALRATLVGVLREVRQRSPQAELLLVGYPQILPVEGPGCYPVVPYTGGDVAYLRGVLDRLNGVVRSAAADGGARYVDTAAATVGHDVCTPPGTRWIEGIVPAAPAAPVHPNAEGAAALARAVLATIGATD